MTRVDKLLTCHCRYSQLTSIRRHCRKNGFGEPYSQNHIRVIISTIKEFQDTGRLTMANTTSNSPLLDSDDPMGILHALLGPWAGRLEITQISSVLTLIAFAFGTLRWLFGSTAKTADYLRSYVSVRVVIPQGSEMYTFVNDWLDRNILPRRLQQSFQFREARDRPSDYPKVTRLSSTAQGLGDGGEVQDFEERPMECAPKLSSVWFFYQGRFFTVSRVKHKSSDDDSEFWEDEDDQGFGSAKSMVITCLGYSSHPVLEFLQTCRKQARASLKKKPELRYREQDGTSSHWCLRETVPARPLSTVHIDSHVLKDLLKDIESYISTTTRRRYLERSIPYQRGYLLHGPPGTGKSTLASVLAARYGLGMFRVQLMQVDSDARLTRLFERLPSSCIVLMEDVDAAGIDREEIIDEPKKRKTSGCTLSGLLNVLDGVGAQEGRIVIMTTNRRDELDSALIRPGRVDKQAYIGLMSSHSAKAMFVRMFRSLEPETEEEKEGALAEKSSAEKCCQGTHETEADIQRLAANFAKLVPENTISPAELQGFFQVHLFCPIEALAAFGD
ncbi:P-loop containing nucleoside triphosphate hydrolase protein [Xylariomycetidae sp. FL2044]|nr:P-loop containing nucleoside triphosphate hydrolase protein [Xylariomycetidae sp. FL2044]